MARKKFTEKQVRKLIRKAERRVASCILADLECGYKKRWIKNKIKSENYIGSDLETYLDDFKFSLK